MGLDRSEPGEVGQEGGREKEGEFPRRWIMPGLKTSKNQQS